MHGILTMAEAADALLESKKARTLQHARKTLVAALMDEGLVACCEKYTRQSIPAVATQGSQEEDGAADGAGVPSDFWRWGHAENFDRALNGGWVPSGPTGSWATSYFETEVTVTAANAAMRYPDFAELAYLGSEPVSLVWTAWGVTVSEIDISRLIDSGRFDTIIKRAGTLPSPRIGNVSNSDLDATKARLIAILVSDFGENAISQEEIFSILMRCATQASSEQNMNPDRLRKFSRLVSKQLSEVRLAQSLVAPT